MHEKDNATHTHNNKWLEISPRRKKRDLDKNGASSSSPPHFCCCYFYLDRRFVDEGPFLQEGKIKKQTEDMPIRCNQLLLMRHFCIAPFLEIMLLLQAKYLLNIILKSRVEDVMHAQARFTENSTVGYCYFFFFFSSCLSPFFVSFASAAMYVYNDKRVSDFVPKVVQAGCLCFILI